MVIPIEAISKGYSSVCEIGFEFSAIFFIISLFLTCLYYVLSVLHAMYLYARLVNISVYILTEIPIRLSNLFYTNSFILVDVNVDVGNAMHSNLVISNGFINYKVLPAFYFYFYKFRVFPITPD